MARFGLQVFKVGEVTAQLDSEMSSWSTVETFVITGSGSIDYSHLAAYDIHCSATCNNSGLGHKIWMDGTTFHYTALSVPSALSGGPFGATAASTVTIFVR